MPIPHSQGQAKYIVLQKYWFVLTRNLLVSFYGAIHFWQRALAVNLDFHGNRDALKQIRLYILLESLSL